MTNENSKDELSGKELYEKMKSEKRAKKESDQSPKASKSSIKIVPYALLLIGVIGIGAWLFQYIKGLSSQGEDYSRGVELMAESHIQPGNEPESYTSNPPTSGPHYGQTAKAGFRSEEISDQNILHNLEHGDIWISYKPTVSQSVVEELKKFAGGKVIITPRSGNDTDIALAAWGRLDTFDLPSGEVDEATKGRIGDFILRYKLKGPEFITTPSTGV